MSPSEMMSRSLDDRARIMRLKVPSKYQTKKISSLVLWVGSSPEAWILVGVNLTHMPGYFSSRYGYSMSMLSLMAASLVFGYIEVNVALRARMMSFLAGVTTRP